MARARKVTFDVVNINICLEQHHGMTEEAVFSAADDVFCRVVDIDKAAFKAGMTFERRTRGFTYSMGSDAKPAVAMKRANHFLDLLFVLGVEHQWVGSVRCMRHELGKVTALRELNWEALGRARDSASLWSPAYIPALSVRQDENGKVLAKIVQGPVQAVIESSTETCGCTLGSFDTPEEAMEAVDKFLR